MQPYPQAAPAPGAEPVITRTREARRRTVPFRFTGQSSEYFRIWIVNTLLTIVTLGVYSAWAKVRKKQYFYRHTWLDDASFEYLANPLSVLKGRLIMGAALGLLFGSQFYSLPLYIALIVLALLATPWVIVKALAFNARNSAYRNVRFSFVARPRAAFGVYFGMMLFYLATLGLGYPYAQWRLTSFVTTHHRFGDESFAWRSRPSQYYKAYFIALAVMLPAYALLIGAVVARDNPATQSLLIGVLALAVYAYLLIPAGFLRARLSNLLYGGLRLGAHSFTSTQRPREVIGLYLTNALAVVASLGLLIPWAQIRLARYRAEHLMLEASGSLEAFAPENPHDPNALGDAASDLGDFDLDLGA